MKKISKYGRNPKLNQKTNCVMARFDDVKWQSPSRCTRNRRCTRKPSFSRRILRTEVQGAEDGQGDTEILHQAVRLPCPVPCHRHQLQLSREGITLPFLGEESDDIAIYVGEVCHRPCEVEPGYCGIFEGNVH